MTDATTQNAQSLEATETGITEIVEVETFDPTNSNFDNMIDTLPLMGKGMLGIFLVTVLIVAAVAILNKATNGKSNK